VKSGTGPGSCPAPCKPAASKNGRRQKKKDPLGKEIIGKKGKRMKELQNRRLRVGLKKSQRIAKKKRTPYLILSKEKGARND